MSVSTDVGTHPEETRSRLSFRKIPDLSLRLNWEGVDLCLNSHPYSSFLTFLSNVYMVVMWSQGLSSIIELSCDYLRITCNVQTKALFGSEPEVCVVAPCALWVTSSDIVWGQDSPQLTSNFRGCNGFCESSSYDWLRVFFSLFLKARC